MSEKFKTLLFSILQKSRQSCNFVTIGKDCKKEELDCDRIAKYENIQFLLFGLCIDLYGSSYAWTQIFPFDCSIALLCKDIGATITILS